MAELLEVPASFFTDITKVSGEEEGGREGEREIEYRKRWGDYVAHLVKPRVEIKLWIRDFQ